MFNTRFVAYLIDAGWSSLAARRAHNPKVVGSNPTPATNKKNKLRNNQSVHKQLHAHGVTLEVTYFYLKHEAPTSVLCVILLQKPP